MKTFTKILMTLSMSFGLAACGPDGDSPNPEWVGHPVDPSMPTDPTRPDAGAVTDPPGVPVDVCQAVAAFSGWSRVAPVPEHDAQGSETIWYAAIALTDGDQYDRIAAAGIPRAFTDSIALIPGQATPEGHVDPESGEVIKAFCLNPTLSVLEWVLAPGAALNRIAKTSAAGAPLFGAIVLLPVPSQIASTEITYQGIHPLSDSAAQQLGF